MTNIRYGQGASAVHIKSSPLLCFSLLYNVGKNRKLSNNFFVDMRLIYIAPLPLPQRNPIDSTSDSKKLWIFSKARHIGSGLSNKFLRSWICGKSKSFVGSKLGQNLHRWHCGFSNTEDLKWMWSRVTLPLIWVLRSCLKTLESPVQRRIEQIMGIYNTGCFFLLVRPENGLVSDP